MDVPLVLTEIEVQQGFKGYKVLNVLSSDRRCRTFCIFGFGFITAEP